MDNVIDNIVLELPTKDVFRLAALCGLRITFAEWHPVTAGEISHVNREIIVNRRAPWPVRRVIAHELGHFIVRQKGLQVEDEEAFCDRFADKLAAGAV